MRGFGTLSMTQAEFAAAFDLTVSKLLARL